MESRSKRKGGGRWGWGGVFVEWLKTAALVFVVLLSTRLFVIDAFSIPTSSMEGTLLVGDFLLVNKLLYGSEVPGTEMRLPPIREPRVGEVVVFAAPHEPNKNYVKRMVATAGDVIEMRNKVLFRNGVALEEPYVRLTDPDRDAVHPDMQWQTPYLALPPRGQYRPTRDNWGPLRVPQDHLFVMGDNRDNSEDSRYWGFVPRSSLLGSPWRVYYSRSMARDGWPEGVRWDRIGARVE